MNILIVAVLSALAAPQANAEAYYTNSRRDSAPAEYYGDGRTLDPTLVVVEEIDGKGYENGLRVSTVDAGKKETLIELLVYRRMSEIREIAKDVRYAIKTVRKSGQKLYVDTDLLRCTSDRLIDSRGKLRYEDNSTRCPSELIANAFYPERRKDAPPAIETVVAANRDLAKGYLNRFMDEQASARITGNYVDYANLFELFPFYKQQLIERIKQTE